MRRSATIATLVVVLIMASILVMGGVHYFIVAPTKIPNALTEGVEAVTEAVTSVPGISMIADSVPSTGLTLPTSNSVFSTALTATGLAKPYELPFIMPGLTAMTTNGYVATASSTAPGFFPWQAFDQGPACWVPESTYNSSTGVYTGSVSTPLTDNTGTKTQVLGEYVQLSLPDKFMLVEYSLSVLGSWSPIAWTLAGANADGSVWRCLDVQQNYNFVENGGTSRIMAITEYLGSFSQFRFIIQAMAPQAEPVQTNLFLQEVSISGLKDDFPA